MYVSVHVNVHLCHNVCMRLCHNLSVSVSIRMFFSVWVCVYVCMCMSVPVSWNLFVISLCHDYIMGKYKTKRDSLNTWDPSLFFSSQLQKISP